MMVSIPQYSFIVNRDIEDIALMNVLIWVDEADKNHDLIDQIAADLSMKLPMENEVRV